MEPVQPPPVHIDYSRCVSINIEGLSSVLSSFHESIQALQDRLDQLFAHIQRYFSLRLDDKDSELADEIVRLKSRMLKCERESEKAKEIPDIQYEMKEIQFNLSGLTDNFTEQQRKLTGHEERIQYALARGEEIKAWLAKQIKDDLEDFEHDKLQPLQSEVNESVKIQIGKAQEELKQSFAPAVARAATKGQSEGEYESPQLIFSKIANLHSRVKRLEDTVITPEKDSDSDLDKEALNKLISDLADLQETVKSLTVETEGGRKMARKQTRVQFGSGGQSVFFQRMEEFEKVIENKASIDLVVSLEGTAYIAKIFDKLEGLTKLFISRNTFKTDTVLQRLHDLEERLSKVAVVQASEDAMLTRKQLGPVQCASCTKEIKRPLGQVLFSSWKKMTLTEGVGRRGFSQTLSAASVDDVRGRPNSSFVG